jgi:hypothetical protein
VEDFYGDFKESFEKAEKLIEKVEVADEESDVICDKCGARMVYKNGAFRAFSRVARATGVQEHAAHHRAHRHALSQVRRENP